MNKVNLGIIRRYASIRKHVLNQKYSISLKENNSNKILRQKTDFSFCTSNKPNFMSEIEDMMEIGQKKKIKGRLIICPTPLGNIQDITIRQYENLLKADIIACEDTQITGKLFKMFKEKKIKEKFYENFEINLSEIKANTSNDDFDNKDKDKNEVDDKETKFFDHLDVNSISKSQEELLQYLDILGFAAKKKDNDFEFIEQDTELYGIHDEFIFYLKKKIIEVKEKNGRGLLISYCKSNETQRLNKLIKAMKYGMKVILVSDAGTPALCDSGFKLVNSTYKENILVTSLPGPTAIAVGVSNSGFPTDRFIFEGYLSKIPWTKMEKLEQVKSQKIACIVLESSNRILKTLLSIEKVFGEDQIISVGIDLTKPQENVLRGRVRDIFEIINGSERMKDVKGDMTLVISPYIAEFNKGLELRKEEKENAEDEGEIVVPTSGENIYQIKGEHLVEILNEKLDTSDEAVASLIADILNISHKKSIKMVSKQRSEVKPLNNYFNKP